MMKQWRISISDPDTLFCAEETFFDVSTFLCSLAILEPDFKNLQEILS